MESGKVRDGPPVALIVGPRQGTAEKVERLLLQVGARPAWVEAPAANGQGLLRAAPLLLVISPGVPLQRGIELCRAVREGGMREGGAYVPILFLLAARGPRPRLEALRAGADAIQQPPLRPEELVLCLRNLLALGARLRGAAGQAAEEGGFLDGDTGFYSRPFLLRRLREEFKRVQRFQEPLSCVVARLDDLEEIRRRLGPAEGQGVITLAARLLAETSRGNNILARLEDGRFCILLPNTSVPGAVAYVDRLRETVAERFARLERFDPPITLSLGISSYPHNNVEKPAQLLALAETALARCRKLGGNRYLLCSQKNNLRFITSSVRWQPSRAPGSRAEAGEAEVGRPQLRDVHLAGATLALLRALAAKDASTRRHSRQTALFAIELGRRLLPTPQSIRELKYAAFLHDVGKIGISERILGKGTRLTLRETEAMRAHAELGVSIVRPLGLAEEVLRIIFHHHENFDGSGYPYGLRGEEIPLGARILAVADAFDAITTSRVYRAHTTAREAARELAAHAGTQFDPRIVEMAVRDLDLILAQVAELADIEDDSLEELLLRKIDYPYPRPFAVPRKASQNRGHPS